MIYQASTSEIPGLEDYLRAFRRRWRIAAFILAALLLAAFFFNSARTERFTAESRVLVGPTPYGATIDNRLVEPVLEREREVVDSLAIAQIAARNTGQTDAALLLEDLDVTFQPDTDTLVIRHTDDDPVLASSIADAFAIAYVDQRQEQAAGFYAADVDSLAAQVVALQAEIDDVNAEIASLSAERGRLIDTGLLATSGQVTAIDNRLIPLRNTISNAEATRRTVDRALADAIAERDAAAPSAEFLQAANPPEQPDGLSDGIVYLIAGVAGLGLGLAGAFIADRLDSRMRDRFELERSLGSPVLASLPSLGLRVRMSGNSLVMSDDRSGKSFARVREAFRSLRSSVRFLGANSDTQAFLVTSARPGEGKTTVSSNLAIALAQGGQRVALVSADMRRPRLDRLFDLGAKKGLSELLSGAEEVGFVEGPVENLWLLPAGAQPGNPAELLSSPSAKSTFELIQESFDVVLYDTPPVLATADAVTIASHGIPVLLVVDGKQTEAEALSIVRSEFDKVGGSIVGAVLNRDPSARRSWNPFGRGSDYYYSKD